MVIFVISYNFFEILKWDYFKKNIFVGQVGCISGYIVQSVEINEIFEIWLVQCGKIDLVKRSRGKRKKECTRLSKKIIGYRKSKVFIKIYCS